jgi:ubiquinone/menaquinone biosynthesis C-methylase UbiE
MTNSDRKRITQEYYSKRAVNYDKQKTRTWKTDKGFDNEIIETIVDAIQASKNKLVLEVCMGTGRTSLPLLKQVEMRLVGLDFSREMLKTAKEKMLPYKKRFDLVLGDAEHLPFERDAFDAVICTSAMHYFAEPTMCLSGFSRVLKRKGSFVLCDLTLHESDKLGFLNRLEKTASRAHEGYMNPSEAKIMLESRGFRVCEMKTFAYRKPLVYLMEDKGTYFDVKSQTLSDFLQTASKSETNLYSMDNNEMTLFYTIITTVKESNS